jgi:hypothetical protein
MTNRFLCVGLNGFDGWGSVLKESKTEVEMELDSDAIYSCALWSLWLRYGPLDLGVGVTVEVP